MRRVWGAPLWAHVVTLGVLLLALVPVVGTSATFSPDEGLVLVQARSLAEGGGWVVEHPLPEIDAENRFYTFPGSSQGTDGMAPFAKHPVYPLVLAGLDRIGGVAAMMALSVLGTLAAAAAAALLARDVAGGLERPVLWAVGVGSPLFFDGYILIAHSLGAALATMAALAAVRGVRQARPRPLLACTGFAAAAVLLRSEALLFALALGLGIVVTGLARRRPALVAWGFVVPAAALAVAYAEKLAQVALIGSANTAVSPPAIQGGFFEARFTAFLNTWLRPSTSLSDLVLIEVTVLVLFGVFVARWRPQRSRLLLALSAGVIAISSAGLIMDPGRVVPGLLVAFPLAVVAIGMVDRRYFDVDGRLLLTVTAGLFIAGVLATQYREGGSAEWGGRYFALAVPLLAVLAIDALARRAAQVQPAVRLGAAAALATSAALLAFGSMASINGVHSFSDRLVDRIHRTAEASSPGDGGAGPVVVAAYGNVPRLAWTSHDGQRWLHNNDGKISAELARRLREDGVGEVVFVGAKPEDVTGYLTDYAVDPGRSWEMGIWKVSTLVARLRR